MAFQKSPTQKYLNIEMSTQESPDTPSREVRTLSVVRNRIQNQKQKQKQKDKDKGKHKDKNKDKDKDKDKDRQKN